MNRSIILRKALAWGVHLFTASGALWGLLSIIAIYQHNWKLYFIWLAVAMLVDGVDGILARLARVKEYAPGLDGALLDNMIDYLNYTIIPALFLIEANLAPPGLAIPMAALMVLSSAYQFCQVDAKTDDHYFKGFPDYWNFVVIYLLLLKWNPWINLAVIVLCAFLIFVPVKYIYPSRAARRRNLHIVLASVWGVVGFIFLMQYPDIPVWVVWVSLLYPVYYAIDSLYTTLAPARREGA